MADIRIMEKINNLVDKMDYKKAYIEIETDNDKFIIEKSKTRQIGFKTEEIKQVRIMANEQNLIPLNKRTQRERKEIAKKGAEAANKKKAERKTLKEELLLLLQENKMQENISLALLEKAKSGDTKAFEVIRDTIGERPVEQVQNLNPPVINVERPKDD